jgi:hypothetical protein
MRAAMAVLASGVGLWIATTEAGTVLVTGAMIFGCGACFVSEGKADDNG